MKIPLVRGYYNSDTSVLKSLCLMKHLFHHIPLPYSPTHGRAFLKTAKKYFHFMGTLWQHFSSLPVNQHLTFCPSSELSKIRHQMGTLWQHFVPYPHKNRTMNHHIFTALPQLVPQWRDYPIIAFRSTRYL